MTLDAEARGERELRDPRAWRVVARVSDATMPLGGGLPGVEKLAGTIRYSAGQLRGLALEGNWLGGPVEIESRRSGARGALTFAVNGVADAAPLLTLLDKADAAQRVNGQFAWSGSAQRNPDDDLWQLSLSSSLGGLESRLPEPFDKARARAVPVKADLIVSSEGVRDFAVESGRGNQIRGQVLAGVTSAHFDVQGISGELRRSSREEDESNLRLDELPLERAPEVLAVAAALLPAKGEVVLTVGEARYATRSLGPLQASITRDERRVVFSLESASGSPHRVTVRGECAAGGRCRADFTAATTHLAPLLRDVRLPAEWPTQSLHASGSLEWPVEVQGDYARSLGGSFSIQAAGAGSDHQLSAHAAVADGQILLTDVQGTGPDLTSCSRGTVASAAGARLRRHGRLRACRTRRRGRAIAGVPGTGLERGARVCGAPRWTKPRRPGACSGTATGRTAPARHPCRNAGPAPPWVAPYNTQHARSGNPDDIRPRDRGKSRGRGPISRRSGAAGRGARRAAGELRLHGQGFG